MWSIRILENTTWSCLGRVRIFLKKSLCIVVSRGLHEDFYFLSNFRLFSLLS